MNNNIKSLVALIWVVFVDSLGWGIAFSVFAALLLTDQSTVLPATVSGSSKYMIYEFLLAVYSVCMFFFAPVLGGIADRYGRKPAMNISMLGLTSGFICCALGCYWSNMWLLMLGRIVSGLTAGSVAVAQAATVDISTPQNKSFYLSILMMANTIGFSLGPILGGLFMISGSMPLGTITFLIGAGMSVAAFLGILFFFDDKYVPKPNNQKINIAKDFLNIKIAFTKPILSHYLLTILFSMTAFGLFFSNIPVFINRQFAAYGASTGSILSFEAILFSITVMFGGKYIFNHFEKTKVVFFTLAIQLVTYLGLSVCVDSFAFNLALFTCISAFAGLMYIALLTMISDTATSDWQGRVMGVVAALSSVSWGVGPLLTGGLNQMNASAAFWFAAGLIAAAYFSLRFAKSNKKESLLVGSDA